MSLEARKAAHRRAERNLVTELERDLSLPIRRWIVTALVTEWGPDGPTGGVHRREVAVDTSTKELAAELAAAKLDEAESLFGGGRWRITNVHPLPPPRQPVSYPYDHVED